MYTIILSGFGRDPLTLTDVHHAAARIVQEQQRTRAAGVRSQARVELRDGRAVVYQVAVADLTTQPAGDPSANPAARWLAEAIEARLILNSLLEPGAVSAQGVYLPSTVAELELRERHQIPDHLGIDVIPTMDEAGRSFGVYFWCRVRVGGVLR